MQSVREIVKENLSSMAKREIVLEEGEDIDDIIAVISAIVEVVGERPIVPEQITRDIILALDIFGFFPDGIRQEFGSMVYSEPEEIREYIKRQRKKIAKAASKDSQKRADAKARVNKAEFSKLRAGENVSALQVFHFFSV